MRQLRGWLAQQDLDTLATKYMLITNGDERGGKVFSSDDLFKEMRSRWTLDEVLQAIDRARNVYTMCGGTLDGPANP